MRPTMASAGRRVGLVAMAAAGSLAVAAPSALGSLALPGGGSAVPWDPAGVPGPGGFAVQIGSPHTPDARGPSAAAGPTRRASVSSEGEEGDNGSTFTTAISADGRYAAYSSFATNLVPGDTNHAADLFVNDAVTGKTERVSLSSDEEQANRMSFHPSLSANGRYVAFSSRASNLVPGDTNGRIDVFVRDRWAGNTERVSVSSEGEQANGLSESYFNASVSADGRYVTFSSNASNLVPGDTNGQADVFVHDRSTGKTERVSVSIPQREQGNGPSALASISGEGRYVVYYSDASNLVPGDTNGESDIFVYDRVTGVTERASVNSQEEEATGCGWMGCNLHPSISANGRYVAFTSDATNLVPDDTNGKWDIFVRDRDSGTTERVSVTSRGEQASEWSQLPSISATGRYVAFDSGAVEFWPCPELAPDYDCYNREFVRDRGTGKTVIVSVSSVGEQANAPSIFPSIAADGHSVSFISDASNLVSDDTNGKTDVFVHRR